MQTVLEQGSIDKPLTFDVGLIQLTRMREGYSTCLVCLCVCVCVFPILAPRAIRRTNSSISDFSAIRA